MRFWIVLPAATSCSTASLGPAARCSRLNVSAGSAMESSSTLNTSMSRSSGGSDIRVSRQYMRLRGIASRSWWRCDVDDLKPCRGYEVGYGKPPKNSQFAKGKSGNPKGRPKGSQNIATVLASVMREKVQLDENGRRRTTTKGKAVVLRVTNAALTGNLDPMNLM